MARHEVDREDLLREATALVERVELAIAGCSEAVVVGFRRGGEASVYFGADPVYQFNLQGELRRGFREGRLIKAEGRRLVYLDRQRSANEVALVREPLGIEASEQLLSDARRQLAELSASLQTGQFREVGRVPAEVDVVARVVAWLKTLPDPLVAADSPNVASKKLP